MGKENYIMDHLSGKIYSILFAIVQLIILNSCSAPQQQRGTLAQLYEEVDYEITCHEEYEVKKEA